MVQLSHITNNVVGFRAIFFMLIKGKILLAIIVVVALACVAIIMLSDNRSHEYEQDFEFASVIPQNTMAYVSFRNMTQFVDNAQYLGMVQLYNDPRMRPLKQLFNSYLSQIDMMLSMVQIDADTIKNAFCGEFALAILNMDFNAIGTMMPDIDAALFLNVGESAPIFKEKLTSLFKMSMEIKNSYCTFYKIVMPTPVPVFIALDNNGLFITTKKETMEYIFSNNTKVLSQSDNFIVAKQTVLPENIGIFTYYNYKNIINKICNFIPEEYTELAKNLLKILKLDQILSISISSTISGDEIVDKVHVQWAIDAVPIVPSYDFLQFLPQDILLLSHNCINSNTIYNVIQQIIEVLPDEMRSLAQEQINNFEQTLGFTLKDFLLSLDNEIMLTISKNSDIEKMDIPKAENQNQQMMIDVMKYIPDVALQIKCKDVEKMQQILTTLIKLIPNAKLNKSEYNDNTLVSLEIPNIPLVPSFIFIDNRLIITLDSNTVKKVATTQNVPLPQELQYTLNKNTILQRSFLNLKEIVQLYYPLILPILENQMEANNMRKSLIPSVKMLQRYITNVSDCSSYQDNQLLEEIHSPCGLFSLNAMLRAAMFLKETLYDIPMKQQYTFPMEID